MILHAGNGLVLTQSADIPTKDRLFLPHVQLHDVEEIKDWKEITIKQRTTIDLIREIGNLNYVL